MRRAQERDGGSRVSWALARAGGIVTGTALRIPVFDRLKREIQEGHVAPARGPGERLAVDFRSLATAKPLLADHCSRFFFV